MKTNSFNEQSSIDDKLSLIKRGVSNLISEAELRNKLFESELNKKPLIVKLGVDPTAPDIHLGHTVVFRKLRHFQILGHSIKFLIGDFTGRIGDPSGRDSTRPPLTEEQILNNAKTYISQISKILGPENLDVVYNSHWLKNMVFEDVIKLAAQSTMSKLMEHNTFKTRFNSSESIRMHEFLYPFLQGYDSVALEADVELGGTDQTFNLTFARELQKSFGQEPQICVTMPILEGTDGKQKMSKSLGNYIGIEEPASTMFDKLMQMNDSNLLPYITLLTDISSREVEEFQDILTNSPTTEDIISIKKHLAFDIVRQYHGIELADTCLNNYGTETKIDIPEYSIQQLDILETGEINIVDLMMQVFTFKSKGECRRLIEPGAVRIDNEKIPNSESMIRPQSGVIIKVGKKQSLRLID